MLKKKLNISGDKNEGGRAPAAGWLRRAKALVIAQLVLCVLAAGAVSLRRGMARDTTEPAPPRAVQAPQATSAAPDRTGVGADEAELVTISPSGFEPSSITRPRGRFMLVVKNRTGLDEVDWRLERETDGVRPHEMRLSNGRLGSKGYVDLPPGTYFLTEANHSDWVCRITITPN